MVKLNCLDLYQNQIFHTLQGVAKYLIHSFLLFKNASFSFEAHMAKKQTFLADLNCKVRPAFIWAELPMCDQYTLRTYC